MVVKPVTLLIDTISHNLNTLVSWFNPNSDDFILKDPIGFILDIINLLNPFSDKFMFKPIQQAFNEFVLNLFSYFNPNHDNFILKKVIKLITDIVDFFTTLLDYLNPFSDNFILKVAFVPKDNFFSDKLKKLDEIIKSKFPFIDQLASIINPSYYSVSISDSAPSITFVLPEKYGGGTHELIDFSYFDEYRDFIFAFMRVIIWFPFLKWLYGRIPSLINGGMGMDYQNKHTGTLTNVNTGEVIDARSSGKLNGKVWK